MLPINWYKTFFPFYNLHTTLSTPASPNIFCGNDFKRIIDTYAKSIKTISIIIKGYFMQRGVIASPAIINIRDNGFMMERTLSSEEVRYYILYWDKIVIPGTNLVYIGIPEEDVLIETGVIDRPKVGFSGSIGGADIGYSFALAQSAVAKELIQNDKTTDWVIHQIGTTLCLPSELLEKRNTLRFDLINLLPVPFNDVPIIDILEFKGRRSDELDNLHLKIEQAYLEALKSPDQDLSAKMAIQELEKAIRDLQTVASEKWPRTSKFDFSIDLNLDGDKIVQNIQTGAVLDFFSNGFETPICTLLGGLTSVLKLKTKDSASLISAAKQDKLAYLSHARKQGIL